MEAFRRSKGIHKVEDNKAAPSRGSSAALSGWTTLEERSGARYDRRSSGKREDTDELSDELSDQRSSQAPASKELDPVYNDLDSAYNSVYGIDSASTYGHRDETLAENLSETPEASASPTHAPKKDRQKQPKQRAKKRSKKDSELGVKRLKPKDLRLTPIEEEEEEGIKVPHLSYGLDKVLFNSGVHQMQDQRSKVYNFDPYLTSIMPIDQFDFDALKAYITSSKDSKLRAISAKHGKKYCGSTSSMTALLSHFHFLVSQWREPNYDHLSKGIKIESRNFTLLSRAPAAAYARLKDGVYAIDADKEFDRENVLSMLGKSMEKLLTLPKEDYEKYRISRSHLLTEEERNADEAFHYTTLGDFMMRSQLDAYDPRLPGTGVFDLKTRAVLTIRMDVHDYEKRRGYELTQRFGQFASFEREYHDLIRAAFLKYSLQVRMGRMDGIFVAFHNTQRIFGFQYIPLEEMDHALHGTERRELGDQEFKASLKILNDLLDRATKKFPGRSLRLVAEARQGKVPFMYFFAEPVSDEEMKESDEASTESTMKLAEEIIDQSQREREVLELTQQEQELEQEQEAESAVDDSEKPIDEGVVKVDDAWRALMAKVEETIENESLGKGFIKESLHDALEEVDFLSDSTAKEYEQDLDALVESLADAFIMPGETREASETNAVDEDSNSNNGSPSVETDPKHDSPPSEPTVEVASEADAPTAPVGETSKSDTLRDLIIQVTKGIEDKKVEELGKFERMLAELAAKTKQASTKPDDNATDERESSTQPPVVTAPSSIDEPEGDEAPQPPVDTAPSSVDEPAGDEAPQPMEEGTPPSDELEFKYTPPKDILGMFVTVRNHQNGRPVDRPELGSEKKFSWVVEYSIQELEDSEARRIYAQSRKRRFDQFDSIRRKKESGYQQHFQSMMLQLSAAGAKFRRAFENEQKGKDLLVAWDKKPLPKEEETSKR
ncbi:unnamed protein product [Clonostachys solani]|uniref:Uncharacterized protein n=1 Tax=Clonostachys solani TaxID=160281 RepID=A0A9N9ZPK2_9HYPO|nr:unnamed protein product [Clonostachys solani]